MNSCSPLFSKDIYDSTQALQERFGQLWEEPVLDFALASSQEEVDRLITFCKKRGEGLTISGKKEAELIERIENEPVENELYARLFDLFSVIKIDHETSSASATNIIRVIIEKLFLESRERFIDLIRKPLFATVWHHLRARKSSLSSEVLLYVQNLSTKLPPKQNRFITPLTTERYEKIYQKLKSYVSTVSREPALVLPKFSIQPIDCIHLGGVCTAFVSFLAKQIVALWNESLFSEKLYSLAEKYHQVAVPEEVYLTHLLYLTIHQQEFQWRGLLKQNFNELQGTSSQVKACAILLLCTAYSISTEKISAFMEEMKYDTQESAYILRAFEEASIEKASIVTRQLKKEGVINDMALQTLAQEMEIDGPQELEAVKSEVVGFYYARKLCGRKFDDIHLNDTLGSSKVIATRLYQKMLAQKNDVQAYTHPVDRFLYKLSGLVLEEPKAVQAEDDCGRWQEWVETALDGVYQFVLPGHNICLVKRNELVYVLDPQDLLLNRREMHQFSVTDKDRVKSYYNALVKQNPTDTRKPWQFCKVEPSS